MGDSFCDRGIGAGGKSQGQNCAGERDWKTCELHSSILGKQRRMAKLFCQCDGLC